MDNLDNCLARVLNVINVLQNNTERIECHDNTCTKPFLGINTELICFNTRPVTLYRCDNTPITLNFTSGELELTSSVFRVENVSNDSVGVLLLQEVIDEENNITYLNTNTYETINLGCVCAIRCLPDTVVNNV